MHRHPTRSRSVIRPTIVCFLSLIALCCLHGCGAGSFSDPDSTLGGNVDSGGPRGGDSVAPAGDEVGLSIKVTPVFCCDPRAMTFEATFANPSRGRGASFVWDFGDGHRGRGMRVNHTYGWPGDYLVVVTATLSDDSVVSAETIVSLEALEVPSGEDDPDPQLPPEEPTDPPAEVELVADAGEDQEVAAGDLVTLDGRGSYEASPEALFFEWRQVKGPTVELADASADVTTFVAPTNITTQTILHFALIVSYGEAIDVDDVIITVAPPPPPLPPVRFAVVLENSLLVQVLNPDEDQSTPQIQSFSGEWGRATIRAVSDIEYELTLHAAQRLNRVFFPWFGQDYPCNRILYPHMMGLEIANDRLARGRWSDENIAVYPGQTVFPGAVLDSETQARGVFASNWPPVEVRVMYSLGRITARYDQVVPPEHTARYRCMIVDAAPGESSMAWHRALDPYKQWLTSHMLEDGLLPIQLPEWLLNAHGWNNVQLQNYDDPMGELRYRWEAWGEMFPLIQTWGSMSDRHYPPDDQTSCCFIDTSLHPRNAELPAVSAQIASEGGYIGHYARPRNTGPVAGTNVNAPANRQFLLDWITINRTQYNANMNYLDWFIARPIGPVLDVARQFRDGLWGYDTVCERAVDVYPTTFLMSGALWGGTNYNTTADLTLDDAPLSQVGISFPRLVRYVLDDRVIFLGESNGDHMLWGTSRGGYFWGERMAFLLGCKLDWAQHIDSGAGTNPAVPAIVEAWTQSRFWQRRPVYMDTIGLTDVPAAFDIRRFHGASGEVILAIDNSAGLPVVRFNLDGQPTTINTTGSWFKIVVLGQ